MKTKSLRSKVVRRSEVQKRKREAFSFQASEEGEAVIQVPDPRNQKMGII